MVEKRLMTARDLMNDPELQTAILGTDQPDASEELPPVLTMAGLGRLFKKSRRAVEMMVLQDKIGSYKDGRVVLCYVIDAVTVWGKPEGSMTDVC